MYLRAIKQSAPAHETLVIAEILSIGPSPFLEEDGYFQPECEFVDQPHCTGHSYFRVGFTAIIIAGCICSVLSTNHNMREREQLPFWSQLVSALLWNKAA